MSENEQEPHDLAALERHARRDLARMVSATRPEIRARLQTMASAAARSATTAPSRAWRLAWPAGAVAAAASVLLVMLWGPKRPVETTAPAADDMALLLNVDNLDLLEQMEFYQWLDREPALLENDAPGAQRS